ncbi:hypothetical protein C4564_04695 [Candidatus Microgenomates bacterium]|nr:MAG: hypothetical protein C4564_04695 [Candidatus Microgenomates bacterium]
MNDTKYFVTAKLAGTPDENGWSCIYESPVKGAHLYLLVSLERTNHSAQIDFAQEGRKIFNKVSSQIENVSEDEVFAEIKEAIAEYVDCGARGMVAEIAGIVRYQNVAYLSLVNGASVYLFRDASLTLLALSQEGAQKTVSGYIKDGDVFLVLTSFACKALPSGVLKPILALRDPDAIVQSFFPKFSHSTPDSLLAILVARATSAKEASVEDVVNKKVFAVPNVNLHRRRVARLLDRMIRIFPDRKIKIQGDTVTLDVHRRRKRSTFAGVGLLILLSISVYFGAQRQSAQRAREAYLPRLNIAREQLSEAVNLSGLNIPKARELLLSARETAKSLVDEGVVDSELNSLVVDISSALGEVAGVYEQDASTFLDLSLVSSGFLGNRIDISDKDIRVLDTSAKKLVNISAETKKTEVIAGPEYLPDAIDTFAYTDRSFILSLDGIREVTSDVELVIKPEWEPKNILAHAFAGNVYVLDKDNNNIIRYPGVRSGFLEGEDWLASGIDVDMSDAISWSIDGNIWVLYASGIVRYGQGLPTNVVVQGLAGELGEVIDMFTSDSEKNIYLLNAANSRVVVIDKEGFFVAEYISPELSSAAQIVVSEELGKIFFLSDSKLYYLDIKK